jgi:hypothetical protein
MFINTTNMYIHTSDYMTNTDVLYILSVGWFIVLNTTCNNISVISWSSVLLVEETVVPGEKRRPVARHWQTLSHNVVSSAPRNERDLNS